MQQYSLEQLKAHDFDMQAAMSKLNELLAQIDTASTPDPQMTYLLVGFLIGLMVGISKGIAIRVYKDDEIQPTLIRLLRKRPELIVFITSFVVLLLLLVVSPPHSYAIGSVAAKILVPTGTASASSWIAENFSSDKSDPDKDTTDYESLI